MSKTIGLRQYVEELKSSNSKELDLKLIEKWMTRNLDVVRIRTGKGQGKKRGQGSIITYHHPCLKGQGGNGNFTVHQLHGTHKGVEKISKFDFKKFVYPSLIQIIEEMEGSCD